MLFLASRGYRCIAHDRRGHGRSSQPWKGNDMDTYADDLAALVEVLGRAGCRPRRPLHGRRRGRALRRTSRYEARREGGTDQRGDTPHAEDRRQSRRRAHGGVRPDPRRRARRPLAVLQGPLRAVLWRQPPGAKVSQGLRDSFWLQGMLAGHNAAYDCIKAFSETDFTEDLKKMTFRR